MSAVPRGGLSRFSTPFGSRGAGFEKPSAEPTAGAAVAGAEDADVEAAAATPAGALCISSLSRRVRLIISAFLCTAFGKSTSKSAHIRISTETALSGSHLCGARPSDCSSQHQASEREHSQRLAHFQSEVACVESGAEVENLLLCRLVASSQELVDHQPKRRHASIVTLRERTVQMELRHNWL